MPPTVRCAARSSCPPSFISSRSATWRCCPAGAWPSACSIKDRWRTTCRWSASSPPMAPCACWRCRRNSEPRVRQYIGSVAADASGRWLAASAPRGNVVLFWDAETGVFAGGIDIADGCGLSRTSLRRRVPADERRRRRRTRDLRRAAPPAEDGIRRPRRWPVGQSRLLPAALTAPHADRRRYFTTIFEKSPAGFGYFRSSPSSVRRRMRAITALRYQLRSAGITYQGAHGVLQRRSAMS